MTHAQTPIDDEQFEIFCQDADARTPAGAAAALRRLRVPEEIVTSLVEKYEEHVGRVQELEIPPVFAAEGRRPWYAGPRPSDDCWPAFVADLQGKGFDRTNIEQIDQASTRIVSLLEHPRTVEFQTKGLVVGHVQSGKTTNYTGVIAKAADRGYRLIIVLAGIHNELRRQTQTRLEAQLVQPNPELWKPLTDESRDFHPPANAPAYFARYSTQKVLCVVKKNAFVLEKLNAWLREATDQLGGIPALVIDDEADQAAVATRRINPLIRNLLVTLPKAAYVGYTATPFANLLIDPSQKDLYPRHFIVDLPKPAGHFGSESIFGRDPLDGEDPADYDDGALDMVRMVPSEEVGLVRPATKKDADGFAPQVPDQLRRAVRYFWLATAARRVRDAAASHSTMLVHTSVRVAVHEGFRPPLEALTRSTAAKLERGDPALEEVLEELWNDEVSRVDATAMGERPVRYSELREHLDDVVAESTVVLDNSRSSDRLDYGGPPVVAIVVGGNTLSRGLTLEGLVVSYFVRSATAYDTLLQMGRWFGYRGGYSDLPRIWMTEELREWFRHLAGVEAEIRQDIYKYRTGSLTPTEFAVRIRSHPSLAITAAAKMENAITATASFGGMRVQTRYYRANDSGWLRTNQSAATALIGEIGGVATAEELSTKAGYLWRSVEAERILSFLGAYQVHEKAPDASADLIRKYVLGRNEAGTLDRWNVAVIGSGRQRRDPFDFGNGVRVPHVVRAKLESPSESADIKTLMSLRDAAVDLDIPPNEGRLTESRIGQLRHEQAPETPLLAIYPIARNSDSNRELRRPLDALEDPIGIGLVFPRPAPGSNDATYFAADLSQVAPSQDAYVEEDDDLFLLEEDTE